MSPEYLLSRSQTSFTSSGARRARSLNSCFSSFRSEKRRSTFASFNTSANLPDFPPGSAGLSPSFVNCLASFGGSQGFESFRYILYIAMWVNSWITVGASVAAVERISARNACMSWSARVPSPARRRIVCSNGSIAAVLIGKLMKVGVATPAAASLPPPSSTTKTSLSEGSSHPLRGVSQPPRQCR